MGQALSWISGTFSPIVEWFESISDALGFDLWSFLVSMTVVSVGLSILVHPAVGGSDKSAKGKKGGKED